MQDISIIGIIVAVVVLVILLFMAIGYVKARLIWRISFQV